MTPHRPTSSLDSPSALGKASTYAEAAQWLDQIRRQAGPLGVPVRELIHEGRRR